MKIGFDAKRFFFNSSGLGNYSRNIVKALSIYEPENDYYLYSPSVNTKYEKAVGENNTIVTPNRLVDKLFKSYWRSFSIVNQLKNDNLNLYHGLSHELPYGIENSNIKSLVTIHDLIFLRHPELFSWVNRKIYLQKVTHSCSVADRIISISEQTTDDIKELLKIDEKKIETVYQGCDTRFYTLISDLDRQAIQQKYNLPSEFLLTVGTIEKRKNALQTLQAMHLGKIDVPFYIIGRKTSYVEVLQKFVSDHQMQKQVVFLHNVPTEDLPALYQLAKAFIYPSIYEGFGIPILEALNSKTPVITGSSKCLSEVGGKDTIYVNTQSVDEMIEAIHVVLSDSEKRSKMINSGLLHAEKFKEKSVANQLMGIYNSL